jgi:hypothetical protein
MCGNYNICIKKSLSPLRDRDNLKPYLINSMPRLQIASAVMPLNAIN